MRNERAELLFNKFDLRGVLENQEANLQAEIDSYDRNYILNVSVDDLAVYLETKYRINPLSIDRNRIHIQSHGEANVDVRYDFNRDIFDKSKPFYLKGTSVTFAIPFEGDKELLFCHASTFTSNPPRANVADKEILITFNAVDPDPETIKKQFENRLDSIEKYIGFVTNDIKPFNDGLKAIIKHKIEARRQKLLKDQGIVAALGYPIKQTSGIPTTYSVPEIKKKVIIRKPEATTAPFTPEPALDLENYEAILKIISNMVLVMERSPKAFVNMKEEDLRQHFLVQLNGHFEGEATGETFNYEGKTDILIRHNGKNIFIAECMYWEGEKSLLEKIGQLLGYTSWKDTKTAILIFNRNVEFSKVLSQIPEVVKKHKNFKRQIEYKSETGFRFILHHNEDTNRELILTVLAFNVPR